MSNSFLSLSYRDRIQTLEKEAAKLKRKSHNLNQQKKRRDKKIAQLLEEAEAREAKHLLELERLRKSLPSDIASVNKKLKAARSAILWICVLLHREGLVPLENPFKDEK